MVQRLLEVHDLRTCFYASGGEVPAVDGISFHINRGEMVGMVGESGCGKSVTSLSIIRLIPGHAGTITGRIAWEGEDLLKKSERQMREIRGNQISMIFQEPMGCLNPVYTVGKQIGEAIELHQGLKSKEALKKAVEALRLVGIPLPERRVREYPYQLSGGMRQRVMIAMAMVCRPKLLIADEPTTALDVTIQAQVLELIRGLKKMLNMSMLIITHDLGIVAEMAERVIVMYAGKIVEEAMVRDLFQKPLHPYTKGLLLSIPRLEGTRKQLHVIRGTVPRSTDFPSGCRFHPRCDYCRQICIQLAPPLRQAGETRRVSCWIGTEDYGESVR